jgi:rod shape-determining protein MreD
MRWIAFTIVAYCLVLAQTSIAQMISFSAFGLGGVGPDLLAIFAVFLAMYVRDGIDLMLAAWVLGMMVDLTADNPFGGPGVIGPMAIAFVLAARVIFSLREALFRDRLATKAIMGMLFAFGAHWFWITSQAILSGGQATWAQYWRLMLESLAVAAYTAILTPLLFMPLGKIRRLLLPLPSSRQR